MKSLYDILGVDKKASPEQIKKAYRKKAKENHTDKGGEHEKMIEVSLSYNVLGNADKRKRYDETGKVDNNSFDEKFMGFINDVFIKLVDNREVEHTDMISEFDLCVDKMLEEFDNRQKVQQERKRRFHEVLVRMNSDKQDHIRKVVQGNMDACNEQLALIKEDIVFFQDCKKVLESYQYRFETKEQPVVYTFQTGTIFNFGG